MLALGGKELTEDNFKKILGESRLDFVKVWRLKEELGGVCLIGVRESVDGTSQVGFRALQFGCQVDGDFRRIEEWRMRSNSPWA